MSGKANLNGRPLEGYVYQAFGLHIRTCFPCPELLPSSQPPEVTVAYGPVPEALAGPSPEGSWNQSAPGLFLLKIKDIAKYLVRNGKEIFIDRAPQASDTEVRLYLLGSVMGALMHQRGRLPLHGSAIRLADGTAAVFLGPSGIGKSTLAAAFRQRGYAVAADDVSLIFTGEDGRPWLQPAYPELKLWAEAAANIGEDAHALPRARTLLEKYSLCFHDQFDWTPLPLSRVYLLETTDNEHFEITRLRGMEKLEALSQNTYRLYFLNGMGQKQSHFRICTALGSKATISRVLRPGQLYLLDDLVNILEGDLGSGSFLTKGIERG